MTKRTLDDFAALVGIDWADRKHDVCLQAGREGQREYLVLEHRPEAIDDWANGLRIRFGNRPVAICLEQTKGALIHALLKYEHLVLYPVNPQALARLRKAFAPSGAKDDPTDAALAVDILLQHFDKLRAWVPDDPRTRQLQALVQGRRRLVEQRVRVTNRLTDNLKGYFPQALDCFDSLDTVLACDFLTRWPSLGEAKRARAGTLREFFQQHGVLLPALVATQTQVAELRALISGIETYDASIKRSFANHPDAFIFASLPGAGPTFAPRLLAAVGSDRERYDSVASLQKYLGIAPVTERSGKSKWVHWRYACPTFLRQSIVEWAGMSMRYSYWAAAYYKQQREKGKKHHIAVRALAFKWLRILYRCWKERKPYDEAKYLFALKKRQAPLLKHMTEPLPAAA